VDRALRISANNRCSDLMVLRYGTRQGGYVVPQCSHPNEAPPQDVQLYEDYGNSFVFGFRPVKGQTYKLAVTVYKGFEAGNRNAHFHLVPADKRVYYKKIHVRLNLSKYVAAGWTLASGPSCHYFPRNAEHKE